MDLTLIDSGPLVALIDSKDNHHERAKALLLDELRGWTTTIACLTEAFYFLGRSSGYAGQAALWRLINLKVVVVAALSNSDLELCESYVERFRDVPCDFADASLLALAERTGTRRVITLDRHFYAYRIGHQHLNVLT